MTIRLYAPDYDFVFVLAVDENSSYTNHLIILGTTFSENSVLVDVIKSWLLKPPHVRIQIILGLIIQLNICIMLLCKVLTVLAWSNK